jgi:aspartate carbamoyltransferase catalytic subunit
VREEEAMDLIGLKELDSAKFLEFLDLADAVVERGWPPRVSDDRFLADGDVEFPLPGGQSIALVFFEPSTRTRVSFELAAARLGIHTVRVGREESSAKKGESAVETCRNLEAMGLAGVVLRHSERETPYRVRERVEIPVINAGNGSGEHPTQALIDALTLRRAFGRRRREPAGKRVAIIGDIAHSRVARSDVLALGYLGCEVVLAGPEPLMPRDTDAWDAEIVSSRAEALEGADAVIMLRVQQERIEGAAHDSNLNVGSYMEAGSYMENWGIDEATAKEFMKPDAFVLHPGPVIYDMELSAAVADGPRSLILEQVSYGAAVRQAVLLKCLTSN